MSSHQHHPHRSAAATLLLDKPHDSWKERYAPNPWIDQTLLPHRFAVKRLSTLDDFAQAIRAARELAAPGDVVLLSPGCASFGMFRNEFHRGEEFRRIVGQLTR